jgi:hypothetical protein
MKTWTPIAEGRAYEMTRCSNRSRHSVSGCSSPPVSTTSRGSRCRASRPAGTDGSADRSDRRTSPTEGADFEAGISIDQIAARELGEDGAASLELSLDTTEFAGACDAGFSCAYTTTLCWRGPTAPVPMEHDPRAVFERLFRPAAPTALNACHA